MKKIDMKIDSILRGFSTQNDANGNEGYFQSFSDPSEAWEVMRGEWDESAPDQERDIAMVLFRVNFFLQSSFSIFS